MTFNILIIPCFATDSEVTTDEEVVTDELTKVDEIVVDGENLPDIRPYVSQTNIYFITQLSDGNIYLYYCPAVYTLRTNAGKTLIYSYNASNQQCAMNRCIYSNNSWIPMQTVTNASTSTILYSSVDIYFSTTTEIYFAKNLESVGVGDIIINDSSTEYELEISTRLSRIEYILLFALILVITAFILYILWRLLYMCI